MNENKYNGSDLMDFKVIRNDGVCAMSTTFISCIPSEEQLNGMADAGYRFELNGKPVTRKKIKEYIKEQRDGR